MYIGRPVRGVQALLIVWLVWCEQCKFNYIWPSSIHLYSSSLIKWNLRIVCSEQGLLDVCPPVCLMAMAERWFSARVACDPCQIL
jgi:hypothetical protein